VLLNSNIVREFIKEAKQNEYRVLSPDDELRATTAMEYLAESRARANIYSKQDKSDESKEVQIANLPLFPFFADYAFSKSHKLDVVQVINNLYN